MKRLLFLWGSRGEPTRESRWGVWLRRLELDGWTVDGRRVDSSASAVVAAIRAARHDAVLLHGDLNDGWRAPWERLIFLCAHRVLFDLDVALYRGDFEDDPIRRRWQRKKIQRLCRRADLVLAGNAALRDFAFRRTPRTILLPSGIDAGRRSPHPRHTTEDPPTLGWWGDRRAVPALEELRPILEKLARKAPKLKIVVWTADGPPVRLGDVLVERRPWTPTPPEDLRDITVAMSPLPFGAWAEGTCAEWPLAALADGVPVIATPRGGQADVISDGHDGFLPPTIDDWVLRLEQLFTHPDLRNQLADAGRETVLRRYSPDALYPIFQKVLEGCFVST